MLEIKKGHHENVELCRLFSDFYLDIDCAKCESTNITLLGTYTSDAHGFYIDIKCNHCGHEGDCGDGEFWDYYEFTGDYFKANP